MTKPILIAGLLGGLLGGVVSFALSRTIKPAKSEPAASAPSELETEGRKVADDFVAKLKAKDFDAFAQAVKVATQSGEEESAKFKKDLLAVRDGANRAFGPSLGEFELVNTRLIGQSAVRFVYTEKFERGGLLWLFLIFRTKDGWKLDAVAWNQSFGGAMALGWLY